jgi:hypothetical protein
LPRVFQKDKQKPLKMTRKDIQFIFICVGAVALVVITAHLLWPPRTAREDVPISQAQVAEYAYVASAQREVFHRSNCEWAKKISPHNLVGFKSREDAINSGRRPCKVCKP